MRSRSKRRADWIAPLGTLLAIVTCYGTLAITGVLSLMGIGIAVHDGVWAGAIALFALLALAGIVLGWRRHGAAAPLFAGLIGSGLVLWAMAVSYSRSVEIAGFVFLVLGAALDWHARRKARPRVELSEESDALQ